MKYRKAFVILNCAKLTTAEARNQLNVPEHSPFLLLSLILLHCFIFLFFIFHMLITVHIWWIELVRTCPFFTPFFDMIVFLDAHFSMQMLFSLNMFLYFVFPNRLHSIPMKPHRDTRRIVTFTVSKKGRRECIHCWVIGSKLTQVMLSIYCHLANHCLTSVLWHKRSHVSHVACLCSDAWNTCFIEKK